MEMIAQWLDSVGSLAFGVSATLFVLINGAAIAVLAIKRDYTLVNRWTSRLLAANLVLLGTGLGVPLATTLVRSAVMALAPVTQGMTSGKSADQRPEPVSPMESRIRD